MAFTAFDIITTAKNELAKFNRGEVNGKTYLNAGGMGNEVNWCAAFVSYIFCTTEGCKKYYKMGYVTGTVQIRDNLVLNKNFVTGTSNYQPRRGDIVMFKHRHNRNDVNHAAIVVEVTSNGFKSIEGNYNDTIQIVSHTRGGDWPVFYAHPKYEDIPSVGDTSFDLPAGHYYGNRPSSSNCHSGRIAADKEAVKMIQRMVGVSADGIFGSGTEEAVKRWQSAHGLTADGMVGGGTWNAMFNGSNGSGSGSTSTTFPLPSGHYFGNRPSSSNCHSGRIAGDKKYVRMIQNKVGVSADGIFGSGTESAVKKWQSNHGLTADGMVGQGTWKAMFS